MKKSLIPSNGFLDDFSEWMGSREGVLSMEALDCVFNVLDNAKADPFERKIIWPSGEHLSIEQSTDRIVKDFDLDRQSTLSHIIGWIQMEYTPKGLDAKQMERFENHIENWVEKYENDLFQGANF